MVRHDLELRVMITTGTAIAVGAAALIMIVLGTMAATGANLGPLDTTASTKPLLVTMLILLAASAALCWQTMLGGLAGLINMRRGNTADTMPAMAAVASILQCIMFLAKPEWYNPATLCLMTGPAALLLCGNAAGKAIDAHTIRDNFTLVSAGMDHAVAYRLKDAGVLRTVTAGLAEPRPNVLVSRPTRLMKGFLRRAANPAAHRIKTSSSLPASLLVQQAWLHSCSPCFTARMPERRSLRWPVYSAWRAAGRYADLRHAHAFDAAQCRADRRRHPRLEGYPTAGPCERAAGHGAGSFPQRVHYAARHQAGAQRGY